MNEITRGLLNVVSDWNGSFKGAYNIREDGGCAGRQSSENIKIEPKQDNPGIVIRISAKAQKEKLARMTASPVSVRPSVSSFPARNGRWELHLHLPPSIMKGGGQPGRTTILRTVFLVLRHRQKIADRLNRTPYCADIYWPLARPTCSGG